MTLDDFGLCLNGDVEGKHWRKVAVASACELIYTQRCFMSKPTGVFTRYISQNEPLKKHTRTEEHGTPQESENQPTNQPAHAECQQGQLGMGMSITLYSLLHLSWVGWNRADQIIMSNFRLLKSSMVRQSLDDLTYVEGAKKKKKKIQFMLMFMHLLDVRSTPYDM
jgi:hypothetical protein